MPREIMHLYPELAGSSSYGGGHPVCPQCRLRHSIQITHQTESDALRFSRTEHCTCTLERDGVTITRDPMCPDHGDDEPEELNP